MSGAARIAVLGAGAAGLAAAHEIARAGGGVEVFEAGDRVGGLAGGFQDTRWEWPLERFYHHWFEGDDEIFRLAQEAGIREKIFFERPVSAVWDAGSRRSFALDSACGLLRCPLLSLSAKLRTGAVLAALRRRRDWRGLEDESADAWLSRWMGEESHAVLWRPLLIAKFGAHHQSVPMSWFWGRVVSRSARLGYCAGGFQAFFDAVAGAVRRAGGRISLSEAAVSIRSAPSGALRVATRDRAEDFDAVVSTLSPSILVGLAPELPEGYTKSLASTKSLSALALVLALKKPLLRGSVYWLSLPATAPAKDESASPFLVLVEHTNLVDPARYGGDRIVYCGDYLPENHPRMRLSDESIRAEMLPRLKEFNPDFDPSWVRASWVHRAAVAQPVPELGQSRRVPAVRTPLPGLYCAAMIQTYPWDRATNHMVALGRQAARLALEDLRVRESQGSRRLDRRP